MRELMKHFQVKLFGEEAERFSEVLRRARERDPTIFHAHIARKLLGLDPPDWIVTEEDVAYFRGQNLSQQRAVRATLSGDNSLPVQDIRSLERHLRKAQEIVTGLKPRASE